MENILEFAKQNYIIFITLSIILILAIIGYFAERRLERDVIIKTDTNPVSEGQQAMHTAEAESKVTNLNATSEETNGINMSVDVK